MRGNSGILLIALGLLVLYVVLSDRYGCFVQFFDCITGNDYNTPEGYTRAAPDSTAPQQSTPPAGDSTPQRGPTVGDWLQGLLFGQRRTPRTPDFTG